MVRRIILTSALALTAFGVGAFLVLLPNVSDACRPSSSATASRVEHAVQRGSSVLIVGDSYTAGRGATDAQHGWAHVIAADAGWRSVIDGESGTGYVNRGATYLHGQTYLSRIRSFSGDRPDLVLVQGSQNDWLVGATELEDAVTETLVAAEQRWPDAVVVAIGPSAPQPRAATTVGISAAVRAGAHAAGVPFIDAVGGDWFTSGNSERYSAGDGEHLNDAGYRSMADRVRYALQELAMSSRTCGAG